MHQNYKRASRIVERKHPWSLHRKVIVPMPAHASSRLDCLYFRKCIWKTRKDEPCQSKDYFSICRVGKCPVSVTRSPGQSPHTPRKPKVVVCMRFRICSWRREKPVTRSSNPGLRFTGGDRPRFVNSACRERIATGMKSRMSDSRKETFFRQLVEGIRRNTLVAREAGDSH